MKALAVATMFVVLLFSGMIAWTFGTASPLSGEPVALLQIHKGQAGEKAASPMTSDKLVQKTALSNSASEGGSEQVVLDVAVADVKANRVSDAGGLSEAGKFGPLPRRAADGRSPAQVYARAPQQEQGQGGKNKLDAAPRIAILVKGLGLDQRLSRRAIRALPADISLAFSPYGRKLAKLVEGARQQGHELLLQLPLEPSNYPEDDTGPQTLLAAHSMAENRPRLHWALSRFGGYFAVVNARGGRFLASKNAVGSLFAELKQRGLHFFRDSASSSDILTSMASEMGLGFSHAQLQIDRKLTPKGVNEALARLEVMAKRSGLAIGVAHMHPVSIDMIARWSRSLKGKGIRLVPVSSSYGRQGRPL